MQIRVGTSGYSYKEWKGTFYPDDLPAAKMLPYYAERFDSVEINNTFYRMPDAKTVAKWGEQVPDGFTFVLKAPQRITHQKKLVGAADDVAYLFDAGASLGSRLGPVLFQLPPYSRKDAGKLREFIAVLPAGRRVAFEFRHESWFDDEIYGILRERDIALCAADTDEVTDPRRSSSRRHHGATCACAAPSTRPARWRSGRHAWSASRGATPTCFSNMKTRGKGRASRSSSAHSFVDGAHAPSLLFADRVTAAQPHGLLDADHAQVREQDLLSVRFQLGGRGTAKAMAPHRARGLPQSHQPLRAGLPRRRAEPLHLAPGRARRRAGGGQDHRPAARRHHFQVRRPPCRCHHARARPHLVPAAEQDRPGLDGHHRPRGADEARQWAGPAWESDERPRRHRRHSAGDERRDGC